MEIASSAAVSAGLTTALALHRAGILIPFTKALASCANWGGHQPAAPRGAPNWENTGAAAGPAGNRRGNLRLCYFNKFGQLIWREPAALLQATSNHQFSVHRGRLQNLLHRTVVERLGEDSLLLGHHLQDYDSSGDGRIRLRFIDRKNGGVPAGAPGRLRHRPPTVFTPACALHYPDEACRSGTVPSCGAASPSPSPS